MRKSGLSGGEIRRAIIAINQEAGLLKTSDVDRNTVRKTLDGRRRYVLHLSAKTVLGIDPPSNEVSQKLVSQVDEDTPF